MEVNCFLIFMTIWYLKDFVFLGPTCFCSGADLKMISHDIEKANFLSENGSGPLGPTRSNIKMKILDMAMAIDSIAYFFGTHSPFEDFLSRSP